MNSRQQVHAEGAARRAVYALNPVLCRVCRKPLAYGQAQRGHDHCSTVCGGVSSAAAKLGKPNPHGIKRQT